MTGGADPDVPRLWQSQPIDLGQTLTSWSLASPSPQGAIQTSEKSLVLH